jgi:hypothetical protein
MSRYKNFCEKLESFQLKMLATESEFKENNQVHYCCPVGHESSISAASFINKTAPKNITKVKSLCTECNTMLFKTEEAREATDKLGFEFLRVERHPTNKDSKVVHYRCTCGNESSTDLRNLKKPDRQSHCIKCQNDPYKVNYDMLKKNFEDRQCVLLTRKENYKNNKQRLDFRCACGKESTIVYQDLLRGRLCMGCKGERAEATSQKIYGVSNPSKNEEIKKKIVETMVKNHGVEYAQQNLDIRAKTDATSLKKYGKLRAFLLPEIFDKIRKTHKAKYGVEFPLQAKEIQDKISLTFMKTLGATRPFLSEIFLQKMKEKYGHEWFCCTDTFKEIMLERFGSEHYVTSDHCKQQMLERFGSEHYVTSDHCKQQMLERFGSEYFITSQTYRDYMLKTYGAESAMQCPELFRKAQASSFCRKPYVSPDGKTFMVLGYEGVALDDILMQEGVKTFYAGEDIEIPVFQYIGDDDKTHYYYPDVYIPDENRVIEIKSVYTYNREPEKTLCKALKVSETHLFELRLYNHKKEVVEILECRNGLFYSKTLGLLEPGVSYKPKNAC